VIDDQQRSRKSQLCPARLSSSQLAIFAAPPVDLRMDDGFIALRLASNAGAYTRQYFAPPSWDGFPAVFAALKPLTNGNPGACAADRVGNRVVNLILHRAIARPSTGHTSPIPILS